MTDSPATAPHGRGKRVWIPILILLVVAAVGGGVWWRLHSASSAPAMGPGGPGGPGGAAAGTASTVVAQPVTTGPMAQMITALGTVTPTDTATVHAQVSGRLTAIYFREGDEVKAGQKLAQIDPRSFQAAVDSAKAQLAHDRALLAAAQVDLKRYQTLLAQDSIASQQVDTQRALVRQYEATVAQDQAAVEQAALQLEYASVTAPISGRVGLKQVDVGNLVQSSDTDGLVVITAVHPINVVFPVTQQQLPELLAQMRAGAAMPVEAWDSANSQRLATGKVASVDNQIDTTTGTVKVKAIFDNREDALFPNQFVNVRLALSTQPDATLVPAAAVQPGSDSPYVFVVQSDGTSVALRKIKTGPGNDQSVSVLEGLTPGEQVVVDGVDRLRDGAKVNVVTARETLKEPPRHHRRNGAGGPGNAPADARPGAPAPGSSEDEHAPAPGSRQPAAGAAGTGARPQGGTAVPADAVHPAAAGAGDTRPRGNWSRPAGESGQHAGSDTAETGRPAAQGDGQRPQGERHREHRQGDAAAPNGSTTGSTSAGAAQSR